MPSFNMRSFLSALTIILVTKLWSPGLKADEKCSTNDFLAYCYKEDDGQVIASFNKCKFQKSVLEDCLFSVMRSIPLKEDFKKVKPIIELLLDNGVDINKGYSNGVVDKVTALHLATNSTLASFLIAKGANVNAQNSIKENPLSYYIRKMNITNFEKRWAAELIRVLVANGADINNRNSLGETPLHNWYYDGSIAEILVDSGADIYSVSSFGRTPGIVDALPSLKDRYICREAGGIYRKSPLSPVKEAISSLKEEVFSQESKDAKEKETCYCGFSIIDPKKEICQKKFDEFRDQCKLRYGSLRVESSQIASDPQWKRYSNLICRCEDGSRINPFVESTACTIKVFHDMSERIQNFGNDTLKFIKKCL